MNKLRLRELAEKFHLPYSVAKKIVKGIKGRGVSIVRMRNEPSNVGYRGWGDAPVAKIERGSKRSPFADLLHEAGHVDAGHLGSKANRGSDLLKGAEGSYPRAHHESGGDILSAARSVLLKEKQANRAAGKILKDSGASPEQISAFAQEQRKNFRTYRKNAWRHAVAGERIKNPSATESDVMGVLQRQAERRGVTPSDGALRSARESVQRQIRMNPINRGRDPIFNNESFGVDGSKSILPLTISEAKRIHKNTSKLWRVREFSALRKRISVEWLPKRVFPDGSKSKSMVASMRLNGREIGKIEATSSWQIKHAQIDPRFRGMGLATKMYGEAMRQAPRGRLASDSAQYAGGNAVWNRLQRNKGYKIRENPKVDAFDEGDGFGVTSRDERPLFIGRITPRALSAKLRLRELARGDYAIPALGKLLKDRSFLEEFATGKRGPKMGDLRVFRWGQVGENRVYAPQGSWFGTESVIPAMKQTRSGIRQEVRIRQEARNQIAKMLRKGRVGGDVYEHIDRRYFSAKLRLRELAAVEWTPKAKAVWRHYFKKAKKQMRGGRFGSDMDGYLPGDRLKSPFGLMWRGANKGEVEKLGTEGRFVSNWSHFSKPGAKRTYVAGGPRQPEGYALTAAAYSDRGALQAARMGHHTDAASEGFEKARIYGIAPSALKRSDNKIRSHIGSYASTAPLRGGIGAKEVRVLLKPTGKKGDSVRWRPAPLGEVMRRDFESAKLRLRELAHRDYAFAR